MTNLFIRKAASVLVAFATLITLAPQTVFASALGAPTNVEIVGGQYTNDTTPTFTWDRPSGATWFEYAFDSVTNDYSLGNVDSYTATSALSHGWHTFYVWAHDNDGNQSAYASVVFEIDTLGPTVPEVSPSTATECEAVTFSVYPYGESAATSCVLYVDGSSVGAMSKNGSTFTKSYTFTWDGTYTVYARCTDGDGNVTSGASRTVTVNDNDNEDETFTVPAVSPSTATEDEAVTFEVTPYGTLDAESCNLYVSGSNVGTMSESSGTFSKSYTFANDGTYTVYAYCEDENGDWTWGTSRNVSVEACDDTDEYPTVPEVSPSSATEDEEVTISVEPEEDENGEEVLWCDLYVNGSNVGDMDEDDGEFTIDYTFTNSGSYTVYATCTDEDYDTTQGDSRTITVSEDEDDETFTVPAVSPSSATEDEEVTFEVTPYGDLDAETCKLYVSGSNVGTMNEDDGEFTLDYTFTNDGNYTVYAYCEDENGDWTKGTSRTVEVNEESDEAERGSLIKMDCGSSTDVADPCRAVYYYDEQGDRHAFPNESTYFTWFSDFDDVVEVSDDFMASLDLGDNVTYRPGSVLVKFDTSSKVYAVEAERTLRHYETTSVLESDYGDDWAEVLVSLPDTLYSNYEIGDEIDSKSDFDRTDAYYSVDSIEDIF